MLADIVNINHVFNSYILEVIDKLTNWPVLPRWFVLPHATLTFGKTGIGTSMTSVGFGWRGFASERLPSSNDDSFNMGEIEDGVNGALNWGWKEER